MNLRPTPESSLRALETWRKYVDDRDRLIRAARSAGATIEQICDASGLAKNTVRDALKVARPSTKGWSGDEEQAIEAHHHPHFVSREQLHPGWVRYEFRPFTGHEPEPHLEPDERLSSEGNKILASEYKAAHEEWLLARYRLELRPVLEESLLRYRAYLVARDVLDAALVPLSDDRVATSHNASRALTVPLAETLAAAMNWDEHAKRVVEVVEGWNGRDAATAYEVLSEWGLDKAMADALGFHLVQGVLGGRSLADTVRQELPNL